MKAIILAGGSNEELYPLTSTRAKATLPISGSPILETTIQQLVKENVTNILIIVKYHHEKIRDYFRYGQQYGASIRYVVQEEKGIGNALLLAEDFIGKDQNFLLIYGDSLVERDSIRILLENFYRENKSVALVAHPIAEGYFGNVYINHAMKITELVEKPKESTLSNYVLVGRFVLSNKIFDWLKDSEGNILSIFEKLIEQDEFYATLYEDDWVDIHYPWQMLQANQLKMNYWNSSMIPKNTKKDSNVNIQGSVHIGQNVTIGSGTHIVGPCFIGDGVFIGNNSLIREYSSIGANSIIGFGCEIKNSILFDGVKLGRLSFIGDSIIGEGSSIGSGVMTVNNYADQVGVDIEVNHSSNKLNTGLKKLGAVLGDHVIIGTSHTLAPGLHLESGRKIKDQISISN